MSFVGIQATVDFYTAQEADITNQLSDIMTSITQATKQSSSVLEEENEAKDAVYEKANSDSTYANSNQYNSDLQKVTDEYQVKLADITEWESELQTQKQTLQTQLQATTSYKESFTSALKQNVQSDFKYAQNQ